MVIFALQQLRYSTNLVFSTIKQNKRVSQKSIIKLTGLSERTVRYALKTLIISGLIKEVVDLSDARKKGYITTLQKPLKFQNPNFEYAEVAKW